MEDTRRDEGAAGSGVGVVEAQHTPTPWRIFEEPNDEVFIGTAEGEPWFICRMRPHCNEHGLPEGVEDKANAEFIVLAVNSHAALHDIAQRLVWMFGDTEPNELALQIAEDPSTLAEFVDRARAYLGVGPGVGARRPGDGRQRRRDGQGQDGGGRDAQG